MAREGAEAAPPRRLKKREIERMRRQRKRAIAGVGVIALVAAGFVAAVLLTPPAAPPHDLQPHEVISNTPMHIHSQLHIMVDGVERQIPGNIGLQGGVWANHDLDHFLDLREGQQGTLSPLHTHDTSGTIHVEAAVTRGFTLDEFFQVWGQPLSSEQVWNLRADGAHAITMNVDGHAVAPSDWGNVVLRDGQQIVIAYNTVS